MVMVWSSNSNMHFGMVLLQFWSVVAIRAASKATARGGPLIVGPCTEHSWGTRVAACCAGLVVDQRFLTQHTRGTITAVAWSRSEARRAKPSGSVTASPCEPCRDTRAGGTRPHVPRHRGRVHHRRGTTGWHGRRTPQAALQYRVLNQNLNILILSAADHLAQQCRA